MWTCGKVEDLASLSNLRIPGIDVKDEIEAHSTLYEAPDRSEELQRSWTSGSGWSGRVITSHRQDFAGFRRDSKPPTIITRVDLAARARARIYELA